MIWLWFLLSGRPEVRILLATLKGIGSFIDALAEIVDEYEAEDAGSKKLDTLTEALDALEDAFDAVNEVVMDEL